MAYTDSETVTGTLPLTGVWIHDPDAPEATLRNFAFGANQRADTFDPMGAPTYFAGRAAPVFDFGDPESETWEVVLDVPFGRTHDTDLALLREFSRARRPLWIRDNRGRAMYATLGPVKISDQPWGESVGFTATVAHREMVEVTS